MEKEEEKKKKVVGHGDVLSRRCKYITRRMGGLYKPEMSIQVRLAARLMLRVEAYFKMMDADDYEPIVSEVSREGNVRLTANPLEKMYLDTIAQLQAALKALGMNFDAKERKDDGALGGILEGFKMED